MTSKISAIALCLMLAFGTLALAGCGGGGSAASDQGGQTSTTQAAGDQDNCYGEDLPAINN